MSQSSVKFGYLTSLAFRNIWNHKRHMFIIIFGFTISVSMLLSVNTWSNTSENLAINSFLDSQDFQAYILSPQQPDDIDLLQEDLRNNPLVGFYTTAYATFGLFNTEGKSNTYQCLPEDTQLNTTSPVSITNAFLTNQSTLDRISFMFNIEGNFTLDDDGIILSLHQAQELSEIYGQDITVGDHVNITIAKHIPIPAYGQNMIESFQGTYFNESYVINGIYTVREGISILQSAVPIEWLSDSIIFNSELLSENDREEMAENDIPYLLLVKFDREIITEDGLDEVVDKMLLFSETVKKDYPSAFIYILDDPLISLMNAYSRAAFSIVFMIPIIMIGVIMTVFTINIVIQSRESEVALLRDRGADTVQIVSLFIIEFAIVSFIGTIIGVALSFPIAALIPSFTSTGFSTTIFKLFINNPTITWWFMIVVIVVLTLVLVGYASVKIFWEISLRHKNSEHDKSARRRMERNITTGIVIGVAGINIIALIISLVNTIKEISGSKNFNFGSTKSAGYTFILFFLLLIFLSQGASLLITNKLQTKLKGFFKRLVFTEAFFLHNNFKRKDKKLSTMTFSLLLVSSMIVFSLIAASSVANNQALESEFKNGADIRVVTYPLDQSFKTNMSQIEGINEVVPVFKTKASIAYDDYTIYGLDPIVYSRVGKWDESSFPDGYSFNNLQILDETYTGIIISEDLAIRLNLSVGDALPVSNLPGGLFHRSFVVAGVITSAPGLGLAHGPNIEMLQPNEGYVIVNDEFFTNELEITSCQLFLASVLPDENIDEIATEVEALLPNIQVNPESINEQFIGSFIEKFVPNVRTFFYMQLIAIILIIIILLIMFTDFTLSQRSQEFAIKLAMGGSRRKITKLLFTEVSIIVLSASLGGIILGILFTYSTFYLITPLLTSHNMIPFSVSIPIIELIVFPIAITAIALIGVLPSIIKHGREKIITALKN